MSGGPEGLGAVLQQLVATVASRHGADASTSYTARLLAGGMPRVAQKVGEEAVETVIEAMRGDSDGVVRESADLLYHLVVLWAAAGVPADAVGRELAARAGRPARPES